MSVQRQDQNGFVSIADVFNQRTVNTAQPGNGPSMSDDHLAPARCPRCKGAGYLVYDVPFGHPKFGHLLPCICRARARSPQLAAALTAALGNLAACTLDSFDLNRPLPRTVRWHGSQMTHAQQRQMLEAAVAEVRAFVQGPARPWIFLYGPCGSGKSHLAAAAYNALAPTLNAGFLTAAALLGYLREGIEDHSVDRRGQEIQMLEVLVIDDLGTEEPSSWGLARLYDLLNYRALHQLPTILTANVPLDALCPERAPAVDTIKWERLISRIAQQIVRPLRLVVGDYRRMHWMEVGE